MIAAYKLSWSSILLRGCNTPVTMECPGALLALLAAILRSAAPTALSELARKFLPFSALIIGTLPNSAFGVVFTAEVSHNNSSPILHVRAVVSHGELLDKREDVEVVLQQVLFFVFLLTQRLQGNIIAIEKLQFLSDLESWDQMALLEI